MVLGNLWGPSSQTIPEVSKRFLAIHDLAFFQGACQFLQDLHPSEAYFHVAKLHGVSVRSLKRWEAASRSCRLGRLPGSGRSYRLSLNGLKKWLETTVIEADGDITGRLIAVQMKHKFGFGSEATVSRILRHLGYRRRKRRFVPLLQPCHIEDRLRWVESKLSVHSDPSVVEVHIDEKWFVSFRHGGTVIVPPGVQLRPKAVVNRRHPAQQMFLAAIAEPRREHHFDGKVALIPVTQRVVAKKASRSRKAGDEYEKSVSMTKSRFLHFVKTGIVPAAVRTVFEWSKKIVIQMDNAGGHGGGRSDMASGTLLELTSWFGDLSDDQKLGLCPQVPPSRWPPVTFVAQPARSPDLNALDLGAWWSLEKAVGEITKKKMMRLGQMR